MKIQWLVIIQLLLYSALPFIFTLLQNPLRLSCFYTYLGSLIVFSQLLGRVYSLSLNPGILISGGDLVRMVILFTVILMVITERDVYLIRNVTLLILILNTFFVLLYHIINNSLTRGAVQVHIPVLTALYNGSWWIAIAGSIFLAGELLLLLILFELVKKKIRKMSLLSLIYPLFFLLIITIDSLFMQIFTSLAGFRSGLSGISGRLSIGGMLCVPVFLFLVIFSNRLQLYVNQPMRIRKLLIRKKGRLLKEIKKQKTALHESSAQLTFLNQKLTQKNKELEQILYAASHDLRSPLVNIEGFTDEVRYSVDELSALVNSENLPGKLAAKFDKIIRQDLARWLGYIDISIDKMRNFLASLLKISRMGTQAFTVIEIDMNKKLDNILKTFEFRISKQQVLVNRGPLPACLGDPVQVNQVFSNLIDNALKYPAPDRQGVISISGKLEDLYAVYCIADNGIGMAKQHLSRVFEPFYRLNEINTPGEGIGLTIVKKIVELLGGDIQVESEPQKGSRFYIKLPHNKRAAADIRIKDK